MTVPIPDKPVHPGDPLEQPLPWVRALAGAIVLLAVWLVAVAVIVMLIELGG
jgi:hypothetical protein